MKQNESRRNRVTSPEDMNHFIRVSSPALWLALILMIAALIGTLAWGVFATIEMREETGETRPVHPIAFVIGR